MSTAASLMTMDDLLSLPDDGKERELIRGELRERPMTMRNRRHSAVEARIAKVLGVWVDGRPEPRGEIVSGEAGFRLRRDPDTFVGIDVAYISAEQVAQAPDDTVYWEGPPILAVEIYSPSDRVQDISEKVEVLFEAGVQLVWLVDPIFRTVVVLRPGAVPRMSNTTEEIQAEPELPGFRAPVARFFAFRPGI